MLEILVRSEASIIFNSIRLEMPSASCLAVHALSRWFVRNRGYCRLSGAEILEDQQRYGLIVAIRSSAYMTGATTYEAPPTVMAHWMGALHLPTRRKHVGGSSRTMGASLDCSPSAHCAGFGV